MPFTIIRNDITKLSVDAIVNAANNRLAAGDGVCGAIFASAGKENLQKACDKIGFCETGNVVITKAFDLPAKYIIHTVGPVYRKGGSGQEELLYSCYKNSLDIAKAKNLSSVAFPLISSGIYGYPKAQALEIARRAISDFLQENDMEIFLVVYDKDSFEISKSLFKRVKTYIDEKSVKPQKRRRFGNIIDFGKKRLFPDISDDDFPEQYEEEDYQFTSTEDGASDPDFKETSYSADVEPTIAYKQNEIPDLYTEKFAKRSLSELVGRKVETFSEMLLRLIDEKGMTDVEVYKRANIDRKLFSKIRKKEYTPKKITVIALAISLKLNMDEAKDLLSRAGFAFSQASKFDIIIEYFIENKNYDIFEINETLFAFDEQVLGA